MKKRRRTYISSNGKSKRKCWYAYQVPGTYISPFVLALEGGVNSNPSSREVSLEDGKSETGPKQLRTLFKEASYTQTTSAEVPVLDTPVEVAEVK